MYKKHLFFRAFLGGRKTFFFPPEPCPATVKTRIKNRVFLLFKTEKPPIQNRVCNTLTCRKVTDLGGEKDLKGLFLCALACCVELSYRQKFLHRLTIFNLRFRLYIKHHFRHPPMNQSVAIVYSTDGL